MISKQLSPKTPSRRMILPQILSVLERCCATTDAVDPVNTLVPGRWAGNFPGAQNSTVIVLREVEWLFERLRGVGAWAAVDGAGESSPSLLQKSENLAPHALRSDQPCCTSR